jgi:hypothetical protein
VRALAREPVNKESTMRSLSLTQFFACLPSAATRHNNNTGQQVSNNISRYHTFPGVRARRTKLKHSSHVYVQLWFETESKNDREKTNEVCCECERVTLKRGIAANERQAAGRRSKSEGAYLGRRTQRASSLARQPLVVGLSLRGIIFFCL